MPLPLDPEPEEHTDDDGHEHEPDKRQAQAHQIGHHASGSPRRMSDRPGNLVGLVLEHALEGLPLFLAGLS